MIGKTEEKENVVDGDTVVVIGAVGIVVAVLRKLNGGRWRRHLVDAGDASGVE